jgi:TonB family protein
MFEGEQLNGVQASPSEMPIESAYGGKGGVVADGQRQGVEILSDTRGVDFGPYIRQLMQTIRESWIGLLPDEARPPLNKEGVSLIRFTIEPDGKVSRMLIEGSTHDIALDRAAWGAISTNKFPALPKAFTGPNLALRVQFRVNGQMDKK